MRGKLAKVASGCWLLPEAIVSIVTFDRDRDSVGAKEVVARPHVVVTVAGTDKDHCLTWRFDTIEAAVEWADRLAQMRNSESEDALGDNQSDTEKRENTG